MLSLAEVLELPVVRRALPELVTGEAARTRAALGARDRDARPGRPAQGRRAGAHDRARRGRRGARTRRAWIGVADRAGPGRAGGRAGLELARAFPAPVVDACARGERAGRRVPPRRCGSSRSPRRSTARCCNAPVRAAAARGGDPPPLHRADPAGPRRARDPRRAGGGGRQPGRARGRRRTRSSTTSPGRAGDDLALSALGRRAPRGGRAARRPRACSRSTCG